MDHWAWVALGYAITVVVIAGYLTVLARRWARVRHRTEEQR